MHTLMALALAFAGLASADDAKIFPGTWEGRFQGTLYLVLELKPGQPLQGMLAVGNIHTNEEGDLVEVTAPQTSHPIQKARIEEGRLLFEWQDDEDTLQFVLRPAAGREAELSILNAPPEVTLKPLRLTKRN